MEKTNEKKAKLRDCNLDKNGIVTCKISKNTFSEVQKEGIKPDKVLFEIEG